METPVRFLADTDGVRPADVPRRRLATGESIPAVGLGTFGSDHVSGEAIAAAVRGAAAAGYRHFDCAAVYGNEARIGEVLSQLQAAGLRREDLWITSKLWNDRHAEPDVIPACRQSLADLRLDYLDLYLVHWPFPVSHRPGCDVTDRCPDAGPYRHERYLKTWRQMEKLVELGLVRHIGTSNMSMAKLKLLLRDAAIRPACNQMELHPHFQQPDLFAFCRDHGIVPVGYCPLGSPHRPERDRQPDDTVCMDDPTIRDIARAHRLHPAAVCIKWAVQRGEIVIPMSSERLHYLANLKAVTGDPLTAAEMEAIARIDRNCRLIKGQVFTWKENQSWEDLWDVTGQLVTA